MITILGMHRSGTSALAGALHKMGADLGQESAWLKAASDNPRGFFEYQPVVDINRAILLALGGTWSAPPPLPSGWTDDSRLAEIAEGAAELAVGLAPTMVVKDPRMSLVQPFWEPITPVVSSVVCLRHPVAVANSLHKRNGFSIDQGLFLWFRYTAAAMLNQPDALRVEYEALLAEPVQELRRTLAHIGFEASDRSVEDAAKTLFSDMAHHRGAPIPDSPIGVICGRLYDLLRSGERIDSAGDLWLWSRLVTELPWAGQDDREINRLRTEINESKLESRRLKEQHDRDTARMHRLETEIRHALEAVDIVSINETADVLRSHERGLP